MPRVITMPRKIPSSNAPKTTPMIAARADLLGGLPVLLGPGHDLPRKLLHLRESIFGLGAGTVLLGHGRVGLMNLFENIPVCRHQGVGVFYERGMTGIQLVEACRTTGLSVAVIACPSTEPPFKNASDIIVEASGQRLEFLLILIKLLQIPSLNVFLKSYPPPGNKNFQLMPKCHQGNLVL